MVRAARVLLGLLLVVTVAGPPPSSARAATRPAGVPRPMDSAASLVAGVAGDADLAAGNRIGGVAGLPDWSRVGYLGGQSLPTDADLAGGACTIDAARLAGEFGVRADDTVDDSGGLQSAIDRIKATCSPSGNARRLSLIVLPAGRIDISRQIYVDANFLVLRGQGAGSGGTRIVFRPDVNTRYDTLTADGSRWNQDTMTFGSAPDTGTGGWIWPGRALFKVQTREVADRYADEWSAAPANRKDLFEGSINQHWASGQKLGSASADPGFSARAGQNVIRLDSKAKMDGFRVGGYVWVGAANSLRFYEQQGLSPDDPGTRENLHMRQQMFRATAVNTSAKTVTLDRPLEYDVPVDSTSDGSAPIAGTVYTSKITPLRAVEGVGFENFAFSQEMEGLPKLLGGVYHPTPTDAVHNYGNLAPEYAMHGIAFKWAANSWARGLAGSMTGSHPIVTEVARNLQIEHNTFDGAWNKGKGGNGYLRGSRVWDSLWAYNTSRNLRHFTFQWSASGNVAFGNDLDSDLNLHGGWERYNLFEGNTVRVPYEHRSGSCTANCGGEGGELEDGTWFPIWWAAAAKAIKWSGASGPQNVFHRNTMIKQSVAGGPYLPYEPYSSDSGESEAIYQFGSDAANPRAFTPLSQGGAPIKDWSGRETVNYAGQGVAVRTGERWPSLFLRDVGQLDPRAGNRQTVMTWNMQGAGSSAGGTYENKYATVLGFLSAGVLAVALQEAGSPPAGSAHERGRYTQNVFANNGVFPPVYEYYLGTLLGEPTRHLYWLNTDTSTQGPNRVNLAIATAQRADQVVVVAGAAGARPALGVRIGATFFFTVHGWSGNGNDMPTTLANIRTYLQNNPDPTTGRPYEWVVLGDFNREPQNLRNALPANQFAVMAPDANTHPTTGPTSTLDYAVTDFGNGAPTLFQAHTERTITNSDHHPVTYGFDLRAAAEVPPLATPTMPGRALLRNAATTSVADAEPNGGPLVVDTAYDLSRAQQWRLEWDNEFPGYLRLQRVREGNSTDDRYLGLADAAPDARAGLGWSPSLTQLWRPVSNGDGTYTLLNYLTGQALTSVAGDFLLAARDATDSPYQRWFFSSSTDLELHRDILPVVAPAGTAAELGVAGPDGVEGRPVQLLPATTGSREWQPVPAGQRGSDRCFYLLHGDEYLTSTPDGGLPVPGAHVVLDDYDPHSQGQLWCVHQDSTSMTIYNNTVVQGQLVQTYLTDHGLHAHLSVESVPDTGREGWRW
ncbi:endonuclease/exonuclease/phosphatase family protein [Micromonospora sp. WMMD987]|uniref:endonuclease/exonuclease/phosphatase family protein n=1 Tax=Micromonospora sp. WMMD987 TaxID=3016089 RepID=UPI00249A4BA8|nr:endonuclease/exonuclease/phosphatase family protein [Micromonospora sp. WMMD987]WFE97178.1 endonuclease/exonuclease/phosphatase family protein [Micromonospora sp. WMMD987]